MRKAEASTKLLVGTMAASLAGLGIVVVAATLSPMQESCTCTVVAPDHHASTPGLEPVDNIPSYHFADPPPPPPRPPVDDPRPMPPPSK